MNKIIRENDAIERIAKEVKGIEIKWVDLDKLMNKYDVDKYRANKKAIWERNNYGLILSLFQSLNEGMEVIDNAINEVSSQRSALGAVQNRLEHTINNLSVSEENLTAAESRIRDVDMAKEMMEFTKNNILTQAAQSMLAQANMQPQGVLQLLQ